MAFFSYNELPVPRIYNYVTSQFLSKMAREYRQVKTLISLVIELNWFNVLKQIHEYISIYKYTTWHTDKSHDMENICLQGFCWCRLLYYENITAFIKWFILEVKLQIFLMPQIIIFLCACTAGTPIQCVSMLRNMLPIVQTFIIHAE